MKHSPEALRSAKLFDSGCGYLVVSRFKADGRVEAGFFLLDVFCLGVKDAGFHRFSSVADYQESLLDRFFHDEDPVRMTPAAARKLAEDAVSYAGARVFAGHRLQKGESRFRRHHKADCNEEFVFGKDGKPFYIQGPSDLPASAERMCARSKPGAAKAATTTSSLLMTSEPLDCGEESGESADHRSCRSNRAGERWPPGCRPATPAWRFG